MSGLPGRDAHIGHVRRAHKGQVIPRSSPGERSPIVHAQRHPASEIRRRAALGLAAGDEIGQLLADALVHRRRLEFVHDQLEELVRPLRRPDRPSRPPRPRNSSSPTGTAGRTRWCSGPACAGCRRNCPTARPRGSPRGQRILAGVADPGLHVALKLLEHLAIHDELLGARDQPALEPAGRVIDHVGARLHRRPERCARSPTSPARPARWPRRRPRSASAARRTARAGRSSASRACIPACRRPARRISCRRWR